jgi:hypothetical protein
MKVNRLKEAIRKMEWKNYLLTVKDEDTVLLKNLIYDNKVICEEREIIFYSYLDGNAPISKLREELQMIIDKEIRIEINAYHFKKFMPYFKENIGEDIEFDAEVKENRTLKLRWLKYKGKVVKRSFHSEPTGSVVPTSERIIPKEEILDLLQVDVNKLIRAYEQRKSFNVILKELKKDVGIEFRPATGYFSTSKAYFGTCFELFYTPQYITLRTKELTKKNYWEVKGIKEDVERIFDYIRADMDNHGKDVGLNFTKEGSTYNIRFAFSVKKENIKEPIKYLLTLDNKEGEE